MSSIIKGNRIRNQSVIQLTDRFSAIHIQYETEEMIDEVIHHKQLDLMEDSEGRENVLEVAKVTLEEAKAEANAILEEAHKKAEEILKEAFLQGEQIRGQASKEKTEILLESKAKEEQIVLEATEEARRLREEAIAEKQAIIESTEGELVETLSDLLTYLVGEEVYHNTTWLTCIVKRMLSECKDSKADMKLYLSPTLFERLTDKEKEYLVKQSNGLTIETKVDLNDTSCLLETKQGMITYDVVEGLNEIISQIKILSTLPQEKR